METIERSIDVEAPVSKVYNQWTQFEEFPKFMEGVDSVTQLDDKHLRWVADIAGRRKEWDAEIFEQVPDQRIAWRSTAGARNSGVVSFHPAGANRTRVDLRMEIEPEGAIESVGASLGAVTRRIEGDLERFKQFIQAKARETGAWRGEIHETTTPGGYSGPAATGRGK